MQPIGLKTRNLSRSVAKSSRRSREGRFVSSSATTRAGETCGTINNVVMPQTPHASDTCPRTEKKATTSESCCNWWSECYANLVAIRC